MSIIPHKKNKAWKTYFTDPGGRFLLLPSAQKGQGSKKRKSNINLLFQFMQCSNATNVQKEGLDHSFEREVL